MKREKKIQKIIILALFAITIVLFIYALGFFTNLVDLKTNARVFYDHAQDYNRLIFNLSFWGIVIIAINLLFEVSSKILYSVIQFVLLGIASIYSVIINIVGFINLLMIQKEYLQVDFDSVRTFSPSYQESNNVFIIGIVIFIIAMIISLITLGLFIYKLRKGGKANEQ